MYENFSLEQKTKEILMIKAIEKALHDYEIYLQFGTLLGAIRDKGLIDSDTDIDVCYMSKYHTAIEVEQEIKDIYRILIEKGMLYNYFTTNIDSNTHYWKEIKEKALKEEIISPFGQAHIRIEHRDVDFFTSWIDETGNYYTCQWGNLGKGNEHFPVEDIEVYNIKLSVPRNSGKILTKLYGNWKIPKKEKSSRKRKAYLKEWLDESKT